MLTYSSNLSVSNWPGIPLAAAAWGLPARLCAQAPGAAAAAADEDIRGPKGLVDVAREPASSLGMWLAIAAGLLVLAVVVWWVWRKRRCRQSLASPRDRALAALVDLDARRDQLGAEAFADHATQVVRNYVDGHFGLAAPRRTSEEFLRDLAHAAGNSPLSGQGDALRGFLKACDLAKFAAASLDADQRGELIRAAREFIRATAAAGPGEPGGRGKARNPGEKAS